MCKVLKYLVGNLNSLESVGHLTLIAQCCFLCVSGVHTYFVSVCTVYLQLCAGSHSNVEVSTVVDFVKCTQTAVFSAFTSCHQSQWLCCLIECWWLLAFPLDSSGAVVYFNPG